MVSKEKRSKGNVGAVALLFRGVSRIFFPTQAARSLLSASVPGLCRVGCRKNFTLSTDLQSRKDAILRNMYWFEAPVAQLDRASDFGSEGWGFKSLQAHAELTESQISWSCDL